MANLTLTVGPITATINASNARAIVILNAYADALDATGTNQERAEAVVRALARHMVNATRHRKQEEARVAAQVEIDRIDWKEES